MKVLFVYSGNRGEMPFIHEQKISLERLHGRIEEFRILGAGITGYLRNALVLRRLIKKHEYDVVHAHYGLAGLLSIMQRRVPVVITYHGSDVNFGANRLLSWVAARLAAFNIFVNASMHKALGCPGNSEVIPCGVDMTRFHVVDQVSARHSMGLEKNRKYALFPSSFSNPVKNYPLAERAVALVGAEVKLVELKGVSRDQVNLLLNACDLLLMTSHSEGSPQVVKEALACNCPVVSTDVGDVSDLVEGVSNCFVVGFDADEIAKSIDLVLQSGARSCGREAIKSLDLDGVAMRVSAIYTRILGKS